MNIAFIHPNFPGASGTGATHSATRIASSLSDRGHELTVYCPDQPEEDPEYQDKFEIRFFNTDFSSPLRHKGERINKYIKTNPSEFDDFDLLHSYPMFTLPSIATIGPEISAKTVISLNAYKAICPKNDMMYMDQEKCSGGSPLKCSLCLVNHGMDIPKKGDESNAYHYLRRAYHVSNKFRSLNLIRKSRDLVNQIDLFLAISEHIMDTYTESGFPEEKIEVVNTVLDDEFLVPHESDFSEPYELLYVGYLKKHKGVEKLPLIMNELRRTDIDFHLTIVGEGFQKNNLKNQVESLELEDMVDLKGHIPNEDLPGLYASHDIFLYPGNWDEPFGRVFMEALAAGTPIIASDVGDVETIIGNGGITVEGTVDNFVKSLVNYVKETDLATVSNLGRQKAMDYKEDTIIEHIEKSYYDAVSFNKD